MKSSLRLVVVFKVIFVMSLPSWAEIINVCYNTRTGNLRYVDNLSDCRPNENPLSLNTEGPAGSNGISCWDLNSNGTCDLGEEDKDGNNVCDALDCQGPEGPPGPAGGFDLSKIYVRFCENTIECLCDDDGSRAISGGVSCGQFRYPISSGPFYRDPSNLNNPDGWTALCKHIDDNSQGAAEDLAVTCIRP